MAADNDVEMTNYRVQFEVEDVMDDPDQVAIPLEPLSPSAAVQQSFTSLAYHTSEAVPNTVYYRNEENAGLSRPSLDTLRLGKAPEPLLTGTQNEAELQREQVDDNVGSESRWFKCCSRFRKKQDQNKKPPKLGWIMGVLVRCLLNIWGVMLFIRLSWIVGQAGIGLASVIVLLSTLVTVVTTLSMSAICTNGEVKGGGAYYMISRSLGPEFGGAIGVIFSLANAVAVALYIVGFAETLTELLMRHNSLIPQVDMINHIRIFGTVTLVLLLTIALVGLDWESKIQIVLLVILFISMADALIGSFIPRDCSHEDTLQGFTFYDIGTFTDNFVPKFQDGEGFFSVFAVFFPAATGILAGANISGDLKDPQTAIPKGTLLAIGISSVVYMIVVWLVGFTVVRDAPGSPSDFFSSVGNFTCGSMNIDNITYCSSSFFNLLSVDNYDDSCVVGVQGCRNLSCEYGSLSRADYKSVCAEGDCEYGLVNYFQVMEMLSAYGPIVTAGIFAATLSSALASLVSAPKVFQRVCQDEIFPLIHFFAKGGGRSGTEPVRGYLLTFVIALACIAIGDLNTIALLISNFFLMAYTLINFSCFAASFTRSPGWRPAFRFYSKWVALAGSAVCLAIMFVISWWAALVTLVAVGALYFIVYWRKPDINWGSSTQAFLYAYAIRNLQKLEKIEDHVKNFRPQFLVLSGPPSSRPDLILFSSHLAHETGVMVCGHVIKGDYTNNRHLLLSNQQKKWLRSKKIKGFYNGVCADSLGQGVRNLLQLSGLGKLRPNTVVIGFKNNWKTSEDLEIEEYVNILHDSFDLLFGVIIFRLRAGFDATDEHADPAKDFNLPEIQIPARKADDSPQLVGGPVAQQAPPSNKDKFGLGLTEVPLRSSDTLVPAPAPSPNKTSELLNLSILSTRSYQRIEDEDSDEEEQVEVHSLDSYKAAVENGDNLLDVNRAASPLPIGTPEMPEIVSLPSRFEKKQEKGSIDVWWLYDDGGLAILLPFLLSQHPLWKDCKLRIFTAGSSRNIDGARLKMTSLLKKFRIQFSDVIEITSLSKRPTKDSIDRYLALPLDNSSAEESSLDKKTLKHIRLGELLHEHSSNARLIVVTISVPRRSVSPRQYMSWLETTSWNLPPVLLMRGNQTSVLTFYS